MVFEQVARKKVYRPAGKESKHQHACKVILLDGTEMDLIIEKPALGNDIFKKVCQRLNLAEIDYFGLSYKRKNSDRKDWLVLMQPVSKQMKHDPWQFWFEVKFYPPEPALLRSEITKFYLCLQVRNDISANRLPCSTLTRILLGSYLIQSQFGDWDRQAHGQATDYLTGYIFAPNQNAETLNDLCELHKTLRGKAAAESELLYLENAKKLALYGVDLHKAGDIENGQVFLGVCSSGVLVYRGNLRINSFVWPKILKITFRRNVFILKLRPGDFERKESKVTFKMSNEQAAERIWRACVEHHTFFRLVAPENAPPRRWYQAFGSMRYMYEGRTQYQTRLAAGLVDQTVFTGRRSTSGPLVGRSTEDNSKKSKDEEKEHVIYTRPFSTFIGSTEMADNPPSDYSLHKSSNPPHCKEKNVRVKRRIEIVDETAQCTGNDLVCSPKDTPFCEIDKTPPLKHDATNTHTPTPPSDNDVMLVELAPESPSVLEALKRISRKRQERFMAADLPSANNVVTSSMGSTPPRQTSTPNVLISPGDSEAKSTVSINVNHPRSVCSPGSMPNDMSVSKSPVDKSKENQHQSPHDFYAATSSKNYDEELSEAIVQATSLNRRMMVEKVQVKHCDQ